MGLISLLSTVYQSNSVHVSRPIDWYGAMLKFMFKRTTNKKQGKYEQSKQLQFSWYGEREESLLNCLLKYQTWPSLVTCKPVNCASEFVFPEIWSVTISNSVLLKTLQFYKVFIRQERRITRILCYLIHMVLKHLPITNLPCYFEWSKVIRVLRFPPKKSLTRTVKVGGFHYPD